MSQHQSITPPTGRFTLVVLAIVAAALGFAWHSPREHWVLGIAIFVVITLLVRWRGYPVTTILRRRLAMWRSGRSARPADRSATDVRTTALLRVAPPESRPDVLPLPLIASYADRYGLRADAIRVTSRDAVSATGATRRDTWIGLTLSAADNLAALQARSPQIPLHKTAEVAARRLADHLREGGWTATIADSDDIPGLYARSARETRGGIIHGSAGYVAAYQVKTDTALPDTLAAIWSYSVREKWTVLEVTGVGDEQTLAVACAFRTDSRPAARGTLPGLISQSGNHRPALTALHPLSTQRLEGHAAPPEGLLLARLRWPTAVGLQRTSRHAAVT